MRRAVLVKLRLCHRLCEARPDQVVRVQQLERAGHLMARAGPGHHLVIAMTVSGLGDDAGIVAPGGQKERDLRIGEEMGPRVFRRSVLLVLCGSGNHEAPAQFLLLSVGAGDNRGGPSACAIIAYRP
jgi:hypothetical protein